MGEPPLALIFGVRPVGATVVAQPRGHKRFVTNCVAWELGPIFATAGQNANSKKTVTSCAPGVVL